MKKPAAIAFLLSACLSLLHAEPADDLTVRLERITAHVYVCIVSGLGQNNYYPLIVTGAGMVVVDTPFYPSVAARVRKRIEEELGRNDFLYVINTHYHWDHTGGNQVFPEATVIGHVTTPIDMGRWTGQNFRAFIDRRKEFFRKKGDQKILAFLAELEQDFRATPPTRTFSDREILDLPDLEIILYHVGREGVKPSLYDHSRSDIFIYVPSERVLCAGDVSFDREWLDSWPAGAEVEFFNGFQAFCRGRDYRIDHVIFGHDPVLLK